MESEDQAWQFVKELDLKHDVDVSITRREQACQQSPDFNVTTVFQLPVTL